MEQSLGIMLNRKEYENIENSPNESHSKEKVDSNSCLEVNSDANSNSTVLIPEKQKSPKKKKTKNEKRPKTIKQSKRSKKAKRSEEDSDFDDFDESNYFSDNRISLNSTRYNKNLTLEESVKECVDFLVNQVVANLEGVPYKKVYNLRHRSGAINVNMSEKVRIVDHRLLFTYSSQYFSGNIDICEYDRSHLDFGNMLNDNIINFYLEYLYTEYMNKELNERHCDYAQALSLAEKTEDTDNAVEIKNLLNRFHIYSTFFYSRIQRDIETTGEKQEEIEKLMKWSKGKEIFDKEFVIIPVFSGSHWSLAILCYPNYLLRYVKEGLKVNGVNYSSQKSKKNSKENESSSTEKQDQESEDQTNNNFFPCILVLNSLKEAATMITRKLRLFLTLILRHLCHSQSLQINYHNLPLILPNVTQQPNSIDCGVYLLLFAQRMIENYGKYHIKENIYRKQQKTNKLFDFLQFPSSLANEMRQSIRDQISEIESKQLTVISDESDSDIECIKMTFVGKKVTNMKGKKKKEKNQVSQSESQPSENKVDNQQLPTTVPVTCFQRRIMPNISIADKQNDIVH